MNGRVALAEVVKFANRQHARIRAREAFLRELNLQAVLLFVADFLKSANSTE